MCVGLRFGIDSSGYNLKKKIYNLITEVSILEIFVKLFTIWLRFQI